MANPKLVVRKILRRLASVLAGPTCDSIDLVAEDVLLPELQIGDLMVGHMMGAYTAATATEFNSLPKTRIVVQNGPAATGLGIPAARDAAFINPAWLNHRSVKK